MSQGVNEVQQRQADRLAFMRKAYEASGGDPQAFVVYEEVGDELGFDAPRLSGVLSYLQDKGLIEIQTSAWVSLTTFGIDEVEALLLNPDQPTLTLAAPASINVLYVREMYGSQVQQGAVSSSQTLGAISSDEQSALKTLLAEYKEALEKYRGEMNADDVQEADAEILTIEAQLKSSRPKRTVVIESLKTLRSIGEGVAAGFITFGLQQQFGLFHV